MIDVLPIGKLSAVGILTLAFCAAACRPVAGADHFARTAAQGKTYFVSPQGNDTSVGSLQHPCKSIARALPLAKPGDTIHLCAGRYGEKISVKVSGAPGKPITIEGERGPKGQWLTSLDPSIPLTAKWAPAPEVGEGVYKMPFPGFEPFLMLVDGKFIPRIWPDHMQDGLGFKKLTYPPDQQVAVQGVPPKASTVKTAISDGHAEPVDATSAKMVSYWDSWGAMYGCKDGTVYIRFRDRDDPNTKAIRIAPKGGGVEIVGASWVVVRDLFVQGGQSCIAVKGPNAAHNTIERCRLVNASERISMDDASYTTLRDNDVTAEFYSEKCRTGAWGSSQHGEAVPYELALKCLFYREYKMFFGPNSTSDYGIRLTGGTDNEICGNHVTKGGQGINITKTVNAHIHDNVVEGMSSIGIIPTMDKVVNVQVYDNLIADCNINIRIHHVDELNQPLQRTVYVYRNRLWNPPGTGDGIFFHFMNNQKPDGYLEPEVYIYHNSFSGQQNAIGCGLTRPLFKTMLVDNVFSASTVIYSGSLFFSSEGWLAGFDYNWLGGSGLRLADGKPAPWCGSHNIEAKGKMLWEASKAPDFSLPARCAARSAGKDLSKPFKLVGKKFPAMPGMASRYFKSVRPNMGAVQSE